MKILLISHRLPHAYAYSGMQIVYQRMTRLMARGHEVSLACFVDEEQDLPYLDTLPPGLKRVELLKTPWVNGLLPTLFTEGRYSATSSFFRYQSDNMRKRVGQMILEGGLDVAIAEFTAMGQFFYHNPYLPAVRRIISCHDSPTLGSRKLIDMLEPSFIWGKQWLEYRHMRMLELRLYHSVDRVLTLTNEERMALLEEDPTVRITAVSPGLRAEMFVPMPEIEKEHAIIITGRFSSDQSHLGATWFLRNVWPVVRRRDPQVVLYLVGRDPTPTMNHLALRDERVVVTGTVEDLRPYLAKSKLYVCPVLSGSGVRGKVLEAMAMELPVISTLVGSEGIAFEQGQNGFLADAPQMMADMICHVLHDDALRDKLGRNARKTVEAHFTWDRSLDLLESVLRDVLSKRSYHIVT